MTEETGPGAMDRVWASEFARMAAKEEAQRTGLDYLAEAAKNDEILRNLLNAVESGALLVYVSAGSAGMTERRAEAKESSFPRGDFPLMLDSAQRWLRGEPPIDPEWRKIDDLFTAIDEVEKEIQYWKSRDDSIPSEAKIIKAELAPLQAKLTFLLERKRSIRGDDLVTVPTAVEGEAAKAVPRTNIETQCARQARRYQMCLDAGLAMPKDDYSAMPRGIGAVAKREGIKRQSFTEDVKAHIARTFKK